MKNLFESFQKNQKNLFENCSRLVHEIKFTFNLNKRDAVLLLSTAAVSYCVYFLNMRHAETFKTELPMKISKIERSKRLELVTLNNFVGSLLQSKMT